MSVSRFRQSQGGKTDETVPLENVAVLPHSPYGDDLGLAVGYSQIATLGRPRAVSGWIECHGCTLVGITIVIAGSAAPAAILDQRLVDRDKLTAQPGQAHPRN